MIRVPWRAAVHSFMGNSALESGCLILYERAGSWAGLFRNSLSRLAGQSRGVAVRETRSIPECRDALKRAPTSVVGVELSGSNIDVALEFVAEAASRFPAAAVFVLAGHEQRAYGGLARELGAIDFVASPRSIRLQAEWIHRRLAQTPSSAMSVTDRIWAELPWSSSG